MATPSPPPPAPPPPDSTTSPAGRAPAATPTPPTTTTTTTTTAPPPSGGAAAGPSGTGFPFPREWHFPPFFTRQPNATTRHAQHDKWAALVLAYCAHHRLYRLSLPSPTSPSSSLWDDLYGASTAAAATTTTPGAHDIFHNRRLRRSLSRADAREVFEHMRASGRAEPVGSAASASTGSYSLSGVFGGGGGGASSSGVEDYYRSSGEMGGGGLGEDGSSAATAAGAAAAMGPLPAGAGATVGAAGAAGAATSLSSSGGAAAAGDGGGAYWIYWRTPDEWARAVEAWVEDTAQRGVVFTLYELTRGEDTRGAEFHGLDPELLQKAVQILVKRGKAQIFGQEDSRGVKFF